MTTKKCPKKKYRVVVLTIQPIAVLKFSLSPPSLHLKVFLKSIKILIRVSDKLEICPLENSEKYEP